MKLIPSASPQKSRDRMWILSHVLFHLTPLLNIPKHPLAMSLLQCEEKDLKGVYVCRATRHACSLSIWPVCTDLDGPVFCSEELSCCVLSLPCELVSRKHVWTPPWRAGHGGVPLPESSATWVKRQSSADVRGCSMDDI